ncbi:SDR family NAD(P)-dependent oxidoreductase [Bacillus horti]|uniref:Short-subunit dehydrogenase n=1 Tax=Caldalkalibacillus horti TaxID=77523 RepID=A0ABT9W4D2_9BACI|nr:SDR family oxidoreductase [Bacillus horti]MDQ0168101.1 short-subunit dehydrogenase [Bacillus horti]
MKKCENKVIIITGASSGLGEEMAKQIALHGGTPILVARSEEKLKRVQENIQSRTKQHAPYYTADVVDYVSLQQVFQSISESHPQIDVLINNAGFGIFRSFIDAPISEFEQMMDVNYLGVVRCTKLILPMMLKQKHGHIINIASQAGKIGTPKSTAYSASKHALLGFTNSLRHELKEQGIHVTAVNPGPIQTPFFDQADISGEYTRNIERFMLKPEKVAQKVIHTIHKPVREVNLPSWMEMGSKLYSLFPGIMEKVLSSSFNKK